MNEKLTEKDNVARKNFFKRMKMPLSELEAYCRACQAYTYENREYIRGIKWRKKLHLLFA